MNECGKTVKTSEVYKLLEELSDLHDKAMMNAKRIISDNAPISEYQNTARSGGYADAYSHCIYRLRNLYFTGEVGIKNATKS